MNSSLQTILSKGKSVATDGTSPPPNSALQTILSKGTTTQAPQLQTPSAPPTLSQRFFGNLKNAVPGANPGMTTSGIDVSAGNVQKARSGLGEVLPIAGSIAGGIGGAFAGGAAASPTVIGAPAGAYAGGVAGSAAGAALGQAANEGIKSLFGHRKGISGSDVAQSAAGYGALEAVGGPFASIAGKGLEVVGETAAKMFIPKSEAEAGLLQAYKAKNSLASRIGSFLGLGKKTSAPSTAAGSAFKKGLVGTESMLGVQAKRAQSKLWSNLIGPALKQATTLVDMEKFFSDTASQIVKDNPELGRQSSLLEALDSVKEDYKGVKTQTLAELQKLKEGWAQFVPDKAYKGKPIAGAYNDVRNQLAGQARTQIYDALGDNVKQAYLDYGNLNGITALGRKAMTGAIQGGTGTSLKNIMERLTIPIGTVGGQTLYKIGEGLEFVGSPGARTIRDIFASPLVTAGTATTDQ